MLELGQGIYDEGGNVEALEGIVLDISDQKKSEHQVTYLKKHDLLTGLYNLNHMEQEKKRLDQPEFLPLSLSICDIACVVIKHVPISSWTTCDTRGQ